MTKPYAAWLTPLPEGLARAKTPADVARAELSVLGLSADLRVDESLGDAYRITEEDGHVAIDGGRTGVLYGAYQYIEAKRTGLPRREGLRSPACDLRMLNCWDNADGSIERGYAGRSLWFEGGRMVWEEARIVQLGRMLASAGINALCVNNVNVIDAEKLTDEWLPDLAGLAALFRPFGVRLMVSVNFAQPISCGLPTADPLDGAVALWWRNRADAMWAAIPDLAGFVVKADSEHRPGPFTYGRSHAEGANLLARAVAPHGGVVVWRAFVYNCRQDWRDRTVDRPKAA